MNWTRKNISLDFRLMIKSVLTSSCGFSLICPALCAARRSQADKGADPRAAGRVGGRQLGGGCR